jgi:hypothetical protein
MVTSTQRHTRSQTTLSLSRSSILCSRRQTTSSSRKEPTKVCVFVCVCVHGVCLPCLASPHQLLSLPHLASEPPTLHTMHAHARTRTRTWI